jgi:6-phosphofructokinase 1
MANNLNLGVLTSGGDAPGMNSALRAVVRTAIDKGASVFAIYEGYQGLVSGGENIKQLTWDSVGGILQLGGTIIGTSRSEEFRTRQGRLAAARNLLEHEIDRLVVIGGEGSLTGALLLSEEWPDHLKELSRSNIVPPSLIRNHPVLHIVGLVGSIDNDMSNTDMTIGADSALHRITEAIDAINSTAASHQRTFVVEIMGRNCGYLALMSSIATGADWVLIPENPPDVDNWEEKMCEYLKAGREAGRRDTFVVVAEGARDRKGIPITSNYVKQVLEEQFGDEVRLTILGHVQRGGAPSAFDRILSTRLGTKAAEVALSSETGSEPQLISLTGNRVVPTSLKKALLETQSIAAAISAHDYEQAMVLRGGNFQEAFQTFRTMLRALPHPFTTGQARLRLAVMHSGALSPGMNTAIRAAVRHGMDRGHVMLGVRNGFQGLVEGEIEELNWMSVNGWAPRGGAELGTNRVIPAGSDFYEIARTIEMYHIDGILVIGGWTAYVAAYQMLVERTRFPAFHLPIVCLPATIDNNLPGTELSIGADTALNNIASAIDKIKQSAVAHHRCFVVEVMGRYCGYLALMSGLATGAERVYLNENGITLRDLQNDLESLRASFQAGKRLGLLIRNECAHPTYSTEFIRNLLEVEGGDTFDVRQAILGHLQQGGNPSPFDRIEATRFATRCIDFLIENGQHDKDESGFIGIQGKDIRFHNLEDFQRMVDEEYQRPKDQWWLDLQQILEVLAHEDPRPEAKEQPV